MLAGFNRAYNARRLRGLKGRSPEMVLRERLTAKPELANPLAKPPDPEILPSALRVVADAKEVSHPDIFLLAFGLLARPRMPSPKITSATSPPFHSPFR